MALNEPPDPDHGPRVKGLEEDGMFREHLGLVLDVEEVEGAWLVLLISRPVYV